MGAASIMVFANIQNPALVSTLFPALHFDFSYSNLCFYVEYLDA